MEVSVRDFPSRPTLYEDGEYRWTYDMKANGNNAPFMFMLKVCLGVSVPIALIMLVLIWEYGAMQAILSALLLLALTVLLPALIWKLLPPNPSFRMSDTEIEAWPKGKSRNLHGLKGLRRMILRPDIDRIDLKWTLNRLMVYVPREDFDTVVDFIRAHAPEGVEVIRE